MFHSENETNVFLPHYAGLGEKLKTRSTITGHFGIVFEETWAGKSRDYSDVNVFHSHENEKPTFPSGFEERCPTKLRFRDGLVWTVGLTVEIKLRFRDGLVWTVGLTVEIKLRCCKFLLVVWTLA